jgi:hypothetical protein
MRFKYHILFGVGAVMALGIYIFLFSVKSSQSAVVQKTEIRLSETSFDTRKVIPGTRISFSYPSKGFYGLGSEIFESEQDEGDNLVKSVAIQTTVPYVAERGSEFVTLTVKARSLRLGETSLKDIIDAIDSNSIEGQYIASNGTYRTINGIPFFLLKVTEDVTVWSARFVVGNDLVTILFAYKLTDGTESQAAYSMNDRIFLDILSGLRIN